MCRPEESEVLSYVVKGFSYAEIARLMEVSTHTVTTHVRGIYRKLAVSSRGEAVYEALQMGLHDAHVKRFVHVVFSLYTCLRDS